MFMVFPAINESLDAADFSPGTTESRGLIRLTDGNQYAGV